MIDRVINDHPEKYLQIIAAIVPKEFNIKAEWLEDMHDSEVIEAPDTIGGLLARDVTPRVGVDQVVLEPVVVPDQA